MLTYKLKKFKSLIFFVTICLLATVYWILYSPYGALKYSEISHEIEKVSSDIDTLTNQNKSMSNEIIKLQEDSKYVEDVARKEYGLLKKNEIVFEFKK